jgi:hypothetical protein
MVCVVVLLSTWDFFFLFCFPSIYSFTFSFLFSFISFPLSLFNQRVSHTFGKCSKKKKVFKR